MDCRTLTNDRLLDHADGISDPAADLHLPTCPACSTRLADLLLIALSLRGLGVRSRTFDSPGSSAIRNRKSATRLFALIAAGLLMIFVPIATNFEVKPVLIETNFIKGPTADRTTVLSTEDGQRLLERICSAGLRIADFRFP